MIRVKSFIFLLVFLAVWISPPAEAASFDCAKAKTPHEKLICGDPALSDLDTQLDRTYKDRRALISPQGADQLQRSEVSWLHYIITVCPPYAPKGVGTWWTPTNCLKQEYQSRLEQLSKAGQKFGPIVFNRIDIFAAKSDSEDSDGSKSGFYIQHVAYPQIDNINNSLADAWNKRASRKLPIDGDCGQGDYDDGYDIKYANDNIISTTWYYSQYCHGTPHGMGGSKVENLVLYPELHELKASDVFGSDDSWVAKFQDLVWEAVQKQGWAPPEGQEDHIKAEILAEVIKPTRWAFTNEGLQIGFNSYEGGCYACTPQPVNLPWDELKPLLAPNSVVH